MSASPRQRSPSARATARPTPAASGGATRTRSSATRRSSRSPTAWAARRPASSPPRSPRRRSARAQRPRAAAARREVVELIQEANRRVHQRALDDAAASGMGTTMTVALFGEDDGSVTIGHVGDSRAYILRDGQLEQLTDDHSLVAELVRRGELSRGGGRGAPAALGDHARARHRPGRRRRHLHRRRRSRATSSCSAPTGSRRWSTPTGIAELVLRHRDDLRRGDARADHGRERPRRRRQHDRGAVRGRADDGAPATRARRRRSSSAGSRPRRGGHAASRGPRRVAAAAGAAAAPLRTTTSRDRRSCRVGERHDRRLGRRRSPRADGEPRADEPASTTRRAAAERRRRGRAGRGTPTPTTAIRPRRVQALALLVIVALAIAIVARSRRA